MKKLIAVIILMSTFFSYSKSIPIEVCKLVAENRKSLADLKARGLTERQIREEIFQKNIQLKKTQDKEFHDVTDQTTEEEIDYLIWMFDKRNSQLSPEQIYSIKFNECFKELKNKGF